MSSEHLVGFGIWKSKGWKHPIKAEVACTYIIVYFWSPFHHVRAAISVVLKEKMQVMVQPRHQKQWHVQHMTVPSLLATLQPTFLVLLIVHVPFIQAATMWHDLMAFVKWWWMWSLWGWSSISSCKSMKILHASGRPVVSFCALSVATAVGFSDSLNPVLDERDCNPWLYALGWLQSQLHDLIWSEGSEVCWSSKINPLM